MTRKRQRRGAMLALIAICLPVMLIISAFCINLAYMELTRTELRAATDAAARAAGRRLALDGDKAAAIAEGQDAASRNVVAGESFSMADADFEFGQSLRPREASRYNFVGGAAPVNAVRVFGKRTAGSEAGEASLFLNRLLLADSFGVSQTSVSTQVEMDVVLILDRSGSMAFAYNEDTPKNTYYPPASAPPGWQFGEAAPPEARWRDTIAAVEIFLDRLTQTPQEERVALVTYSDTASADLEFKTSSEYTQIIDALNIYTSSYQSGATNIGGGISKALDSLSTSLLARPWAAKAVILLTDGNHNTGTNPVSAATAASDAGIAIYTITFSQEANQKQMQKVAKKGKGKHFHAETNDDLIDAFRDAAASLPTLLTR